MTKLDIDENEFTWDQKYRPKTINDTIISEKYKKIFQKFISEGDIPNFILSGPPGIGKTTIAMAMLDELKCDYIKINGSLNGGIDTLRYDISNFASSVSFLGKRKYVIIDEADFLTMNTQAALRGFIEEFSKNCGFILTCNYVNKIVEPLRKSRFSEINFSIEKNEKPKLAAQFFKRVISILDNENVKYDQKTVAKIVEQFFPDFRRTLNQLQKISSLGDIDSSSLINNKNESLDVLFDHLKNKKFTEMRKWVGENSDQDYNVMYRNIYDMSTDKIELKSMPGLVTILADYMYKHNFSADPEINFVAFLTEIMLELQFK